mmetsp:Transcript_3557/g.5373  ORF Transcript_3557/g.5373 Transcript_3557/m.5373 type:complete len:88 (-) Transcript_3557:1297-1560(-)
MWPWSEQPNITTLLYSHKQNQTDPSREVPQADDSMRPGSFSAAADLQVDGELLEAAKLQVYWLVFIILSSGNLWSGPRPISILGFLP